MCRYAFYQYKSHYACFKCKKGFKRKNLGDITRAKIESKPFHCPECRSLMANVGLDCEIPKKSNTQQWKVLESLYEIGITYHSCGCGGPGYMPKELDELKSFLLNMKTVYSNHYKSSLSKDGLKTVQKSERTESLKHWSFKIREIEGLLDKL